MPWGWRETKTKTYKIWRVRITRSWRPIFHLPRITISLGGK